MTANPREHPVSATVIEFLYFEGCPLAPDCLHALEEAVARLPRESAVTIRAIDIMAPGAPEELRRWGSPTILFDGEDLVGGDRGDAASCRVYDAPGGIPGAEELEAALRDKLRA